MIEAGLGLYAIAIPAAMLALMSVTEWLWPRRNLVLGRTPRWLTHVLFFLTNAVVGRILSMVVVVGSAAVWADTHDFGLFNQTVWPWWAEALLAFILLDLAVWAQHLSMHRSGFLWAMHKVHHSDRDLDATTALRFHPFELIVSTLFKSACVALLGVPVLVALAFELWLNCNALFNHSNIRLPHQIDRIIRAILVTPDMHLVHHSTNVAEQNRNFGFALTWWDRLFGTYADESAMGRDHQTIGLTEAEDNRPARYLWSMKLPMT
ncbi:sterol desaturase family protein [Sphingorhabdus sp.]|uniref:sterol desaturase family protein n=1 Tax=Sphingorhabdus sp. TaxID=1902408 RepID=UPI003592E9BC